MHQRSSNRLAKPASGPDCSVPAMGWAGRKCTPLGTKGATSLDHRALDRTDIGQNRARLEMRRDRGRRSPCSCPTGEQRITRSASLHRLRRAGGDGGKPQFGGAMAHRFAGVIAGDRLRQLLALDRMRQRGADQAQTDQGDAVEHQRPMNSRKAATTRSLASARADGEAQGIGQAVIGDAAQDQAALRQGKRRPWPRLSRLCGN